MFDWTLNRSIYCGNFLILPIWHFANMAYIYACHLSISLCHYGEHVEWRQLMTYFHMIRPEVKEQIPCFKIKYKYKYKSYQGYTNKMSMSDDEASTTFCWTGSLVTLPHHLDLITVMTNNYEIYETRSLGPLLNHMSKKKGGQLNCQNVVIKRTNERAMEKSSFRMLSIPIS